MSLGKTLTVFALLFVAFVAGDTATAFAQSGGSWKALNMSGYIQRRFETVTGVNGKLYAIGGELEGKFDSLIQTVNIYDPTTDTWSDAHATGSFIGRWAHCATELNGKIYVFGGAGVDPTTGQSASLTALQIYDPVTNAWTTPVTTGSPIARHQLASVAAEGKLYLFPGYAPSSSATIDVFDPTTNTFDTLKSNSGSFPPIYFSALVTIGSKIYSLGGVDKTTFERSPSILSFDLSSKSWSEELPGGDIGDYVSTAGLDGKIYLVTGSNLLSVYSLTTRVYDPVASTVTDLFAEPYTGGSAAAVSTGDKLYLMGGVYTSGSGVHTLQVFTPGESAVQTSAPATTMELLPNPVTTMLHVNNIPKNTRLIAVRNVLGKQVIEAAAVQSDAVALDVSKLASGMYWLECAGANSKGFPFVKQ